MTESESPDEILARRISQLKNLRDNYSNDIPEQIIHSTDDDNKYKVRKAWWTALGANLRAQLHEGIITNPQIKENVETFLNTPDAEITTKEDIDRANKIINIMLGDEPPIITNADKD